MDVLERGDIVRITDANEKCKHGIVVHTFDGGGSFSAVSQNGFWALAERTDWEKVGHLDISAIYDKLKELDGFLYRDEVVADENSSHRP